MERIVEQIAEETVATLRSYACPANVDGMARYGISSAGTLGATMPQVRGLARDAKRAVGRDAEARHELARMFWATGIHEARILAALVDVPALVTREQAEVWALDLDSWDTCDQLCSNLLALTPYAWELPADWTRGPETYVKRAGFVVAAQLAVKDKATDPHRYEALLGLVVANGFDARNDVKKGANWALRQIGKRDPVSHRAAIATAERLLAAVPERGGSEEERAARWIARDALRELRDPAVVARFNI